MNIFGLGSAELAELGLKFISVPVPIFPVLQNIYRMKMNWFVTKDLLINKLSNVDPLIIFDITNVYKQQPKVNESLIPDFIKMNKEGFYVRAIIDMPQHDWRILKTNIIQSENHNFTFKWNIDNYKDELFKTAKLQEEKSLELQIKADIEEAAFLKEHGGKKVKKYIKSW